MGDKLNSSVTLLYRSAPLENLGFDLNENKFEEISQ